MKVLVQWSGGRKDSLGFSFCGVCAEKAKAIFAPLMLLIEKQQATTVDLDKFFSVSLCIGTTCEHVKNADNIRESKSKSQRGITPHPSGWLFKKKQQKITSVGEDLEKLETVCTADGNIK